GRKSGPRRASGPIARPPEGVAAHGIKTSWAVLRGRREPSMGVVVTAATDVGLKRAQNEDSHGSWIPPEPDERRRRGVLLVIADGMGGSRAGEVASRLAVQTVLRVYREAGGSDPLEDLFRAVEA